MTTTTQCRLCGATNGLHDVGEHGEYRICSPCWEIVASVAQRSVAALEARVAHLERTRPAEVDPLRLLDLSEVARRLGFARATVTKLRPQLPIIDLPSGKGTLPFVREADLLAWLESHKRKATP